MRPAKVFEVGSVVRLRGSGVPMTVEGESESGVVACVWIDSAGLLQRARFMGKVLALWIRPIAVPEPVADLVSARLKKEQD
jgi:uncharacterized protein YodC (DUF2158 family)